jgi:hypothetical protein
MKLIRVKEYQEIFKDDKYTPVSIDAIINLDQITLVREVIDGLLIFLTGRDKAITIKDEDSIKLFYKESGLRRVNS